MKPLYNENMEMNFCRRCGTPLTQQTSEIYKCKNSHTLFVNAAPAAGIFFITDNNELLLSVRGIEPFKGRLDSFGGFINDQETVEDALAREILEETGLSPDQYEPPVFLSTETGFYPYENEPRSILSIFFWSRLKPGAILTPADDVAAIKSVPLADIDLDAMDNTDVRKAVLRIQKNLL